MIIWHLSSLKQIIITLLKVQIIFRNIVNSTYHMNTKAYVFFEILNFVLHFHGLQLDGEKCYKKHQQIIQEDSKINGLNAHNFILCMNIKDLSEEVKNALKYTALCNYSIKNLSVAVLQKREFLFGKPNSSTQIKCSIAQRTM